MEKRKDSDKKASSENLDQLNAELDPEYTKSFVKRMRLITPYLIFLLVGEVILTSCKVSKFNKFNWQQERNLIITNENIYNFKQKSKYTDAFNLSKRGEENNRNRETLWFNKKFKSLI